MWELVKHSEKDINTEGGASDWGKLCARREAQCRPTLEQDCNQSNTTTNCVKPFVNCSKNSVSTHEHLGYKSVTPWRLLHFHFSSRLMECIQKQNFLHIFYALLIFKALTEEYTYNLAHMVQTNRKTSSHLKGVQVGRSPHKEYELWTLNPWITKQTNKQKYKGKLK